MRRRGDSRDSAQPPGHASSTVAAAAISAVSSVFPSWRRYSGVLKMCETFSHDSEPAAGLVTSGVSVYQTSVASGAAIITPRITAAGPTGPRRRPAR